MDCIFRLIDCHALIERSRSNAASQWLCIQANQCKLSSFTRFFAGCGRGRIARATCNGSDIQRRRWERLQRLAAQTRAIMLDT